jgi:type IV secretion system protein VirB8
MITFKQTTKAEDVGPDWYVDRYQSILVSRNRWLVVGIVGLGLATCQGIALLFLMPLKTTVPFLVKEEVSGAVTTVTKLTGDATLTHDEAMRKYFLAKYVMSRETYDPVDLLEGYRAVELMSDENEARAFHQAIVANNPTSPIVVFGSQAKRFVRIKSIAFLNDNAAQLRFSAIERRGSSPDKNSDWIATVGFGFGKVSAAEADRLVNPLGFAVTSYRIDQEVVP